MTARHALDTDKVEELQAYPSGCGGYNPPW